MDYSYARFLKLSYEAGELIVAARPYVTSVFPSQCLSYCAHCLAAGSASGAEGCGVDGTATLSPCEGCGWDHYCSARCQQTAWSAVHRHECSLLRAWTESGRERVTLLHRTRLLFRVVVFENSDGRQYPCMSGRSSSQPPGKCDRIEDPGWRRSHAELLSHRDDHARRPDLYRPVTDCLAVLCSASADVAAAMPLLDDLVESLGRMRCNCFEIYDARGDIVAEAMYLSPTLFDHSCLPNASYSTTDGTLLEVRALRRIDTSSEPILISYFGDQRLRSTRERQEFFNNCFFFECSCARCDGSPPALARDRRLQSARCVLGDECRKLPSCEHCEAVEDGDAGAATAAAKLEASHAASADAVLQRLREATECGDWRLVVEAARRYLLDDGASLGVCNVRVVRVRERLVAACHELTDEWRLGVEHGLVLLDVYLSVCPEAVVYIAKLRSMIGSMLLRGRRFGDAARQLSEAAATLRITCGPDHPLTAECRRLLAAAALEKAAAERTLAA